MNPPQSLRDEVLTYLREHNTMTLATAAEGRPWAATVFYAHRGLELYFLSDPDSRHCRELAASPQVAATITEDHQDWRRIKGIQLEGVVQPVSSRREQVVALAAYVAKFPFVVGFFPTPAMRLSQMRIGGRPVSVRLYKVVPQRLLYLDNEKGFHHREELVLGAPQGRGSVPGLAQTHESGDAKGALPPCPGSGGVPQN